MGYRFDLHPVRALVPTGDVRGNQQTESLPWLANRQSLALYGAVAPSDRVELVVGLPFLISQTARAGRDTAPGPSGSSEIGDLHMIARFGVLPADAPIAWSIQAGVIAPTGAPDALFGERRARLEIGTGVSVPLPKAIQLDAYLQHRSGAMSTIGDQIFGDTFSVMAGAHQRLGDFQWHGELRIETVLSARPSQTLPKRAAMQVAGGGRYIAESFFVDLSAGVGILDQHTTSRFHVAASIGTFGAFGRTDEGRGPSSATLVADGCIEVCGASERLDRIERLLESHARSSACVAPEPDFDGPTTDEGCVDFSEWYAQQPEDEAHHIYFEIDSSALQSGNTRALQGLALHLAHTDRPATISGHADDSGATERNQELSRLRAEAVRGALIAAGIDGARLRVEAHGDDTPIAPSTDFGRSMNRRVTVQLTER